MSSGHLTGQPGKGDCSTVQKPKGRKGIIIVCGSLYLYEVHWMHSPGHPDLALNVSWQSYRNKTIHNFIEHTCNESADRRASVRLDAPLCPYDFHSGN